MVMNVALVVVLTHLSLAGCAVVEESWIIPGAQVAALHNAKRALHVDTPPLTSDLMLSIKAKKCAIWMTINAEIIDASQHPCKPFEADGQGENIYIGTGLTSGSVSKELQPAMDGWYNSELPFIDFDSRWYFRADNRVIGHLTQVLWVATTKVGCAGSSSVKGQWRTTYIVCRYWRPGNQFFSAPLIANVKPPKVKLISAEDCKDSIPALCGSLQGGTPTAISQYCNGPMSDLFLEGCAKSCGTC